MKVENAGHVLGHQQVVRVGKITEPSFNYINQVALNSGMGTLSESLSYTQAVAAMEMKRGEEGLAGSNAGAKAAMAETQEAMAESQEGLGELGDISERNRRETKRKLSILEQQKSFFDSITISNILSEYNEEISKGRQEDLENNPGGEGHLERMTGKHNELVAKYLSESLEPAIKQYLIPKFKEAGAHVANQAFNDEQTRTVARAEIAIEEALERATLHVANGMNPEEAIKELDPIAESIPNSMPWKEKSLKKVRSELIEYSLRRTAMVNPALAARNMSMEDSIYGELTPEQRERVEHIIKAVQKDMIQQANKLKDLEYTAKITSHSGEISKCFESIWSGKFGYAELEGKKGELTPYEYGELLKAIATRNENEKHEIKKQLVIEAKAGKDGNYYSFSAGEQNRIWLRKIQTEEFTFKGEAVNNSNRLQSYARELSKFNQEIPIVKRDLKINMLYGTAEQSLDAVLAFRELYATNRIILGGDHAANDIEVQAMLDFSTQLEAGMTIVEAQKKTKESLAPITIEERRKLEASFKEEFSGGGLEEGLKKYGVEFEEGDFVGVRTAERLARSYYIGSRGDKVRAIQMSVESINASYRASIVNGPGAEGYKMWQAPEGLFAGKGYTDDLIRKVFCNRAAELAAESIGNSEGWLEILPVEEGKPNQCVWHKANGVLENGIFWFEHKPGSVGQYRIKYNTKRNWGPVEALRATVDGPQVVTEFEIERGAGTGFVLERNVNGIQKEAIVNIDELDWDLSLAPMLAQGLIGGE